MLRGKGVGHRLIHAAVDFCHRNGYPRVYLWTFEGLLPARHLYETAGFQLVEASLTSCPAQAQWSRTISFYKANGFSEIGPRLQHRLTIAPGIAQRGGDQDAL